jgi:hypothetical protein
MVVETAVVATSSRTATLSMTPQRALRFSVAFTLFGASMHYLVSGRKEASLNKMITGAILAFLSLLCL